MKDFNIQPNSIIYSKLHSTVKQRGTRDQSDEIFFEWKQYRSHLKNTKSSAYYSNNTEGFLEDIAMSSEEGVK
jgi:hypothetical protein